MRWFISYRYTIKEFLEPMTHDIRWDNVIIDITPACWMAKKGAKYTILYAEEISLALASELRYGGAGILTEYSDQEE